MAMTQNYGMGWKRDLPDMRDLRYTAPERHIVLPEEVDLRPLCPPVYDQDGLGSCTAFACTGALEYLHKNQVGEDMRFSELFLYYEERKREHSIPYDAGAYIRDGMKEMARHGVCPEELWPYIPEKFADAPPPAAYSAAKADKLLRYSRVAQDKYHIQYALFNGNPVVFGFTVYDSFFNTSVEQTGIVPLPEPGEGVQGGHAVVAVGYSNASEWFIVRNSWSDTWGDKGYFYMPYAYVTNADLAADFWITQRVQ